jgi:hypothetical protein
MEPAQLSALPLTSVFTPYTWSGQKGRLGKGWGGVGACKNMKNSATGGGGVCGVGNCVAGCFGIEVLCLFWLQPGADLCCCCCSAKKLASAIAAAEG